nr:serine/arginine repetitive matrix protein 1 isoform X1 [Tanacetum cinerariifolium]
MLTAVASLFCWQWELSSLAVGTFSGSGNSITGTELLGSEDEVLMNFIYGLQEENLVNGKEIQISLTGFMEKNTGKFMKEPWTHLLSAQENASGVPQQFLDAKEEESRKKQEDSDRITTELKRAKEKEGEGHVLPFNEGHVLPFDGGHVPLLDDGYDPPSAEGLNLLLVEGRGPLSGGQCVLPSGGDCVPPAGEGLPSGAGHHPQSLLYKTFFWFTEFGGAVPYRPAEDLSIMEEPILGRLR